MNKQLEKAKQETIEELGFLVYILQRQIEVLNDTATAAHAQLMQMLNDTPPDLSDPRIVALLETSAKINKGYPCLIAGQSEEQLLNHTFGVLLGTVPNVIETMRAAGRLNEEETIVKMLKRENELLANAENKMH